MARTSLLSSLRRHGPADYALLGEAAATLAAASAAIRLVPFRRTAAAATWGGRTARAADEAELIRQARWAVEAAARRVPWRTVCFQKGLALHWMLRRRGVASLLHYGVGKAVEGDDLAAHVWVSVRGEIVIGGEEAPRFACLATFPDSPQPAAMR